MLRALHEVESGMGVSIRRRLANEIMKGAGDYLPFGTLGTFIKADLPDAEAERLISERKRYLERARHLFPSMLKMLQARNYESIRSVLLEIGDCCRDFPIIEQSNHSKKQRKELSQNLDELKCSLEAALRRIEKCNNYVDTEFENHKSAVRRIVNSDYLPLKTLEQVDGELRHLIFSTDIARYKTRIGHDHIYISDNKARTHIVECAYSLCLYLGSPPFVTTPGSEFSFLCSLILELATGKPDESLAGAINKFARSELRKQLDQHEAELRIEGSDEGMREYEEDNFAGVKERLRCLIEQYDFWKDMAASGPWDEFPAEQLKLRTLDVLEQISKATQEHGPFLVWASQFSERDQEQSCRQIEDIEARLLSLEIEIGRLRRAKRSN
jgi:hypothetical protein